MSATRRHIVLAIGHALDEAVTGARVSFEVLGVKVNVDSGDAVALVKVTSEKPEVSGTWSLELYLDLDPHGFHGPVEEWFVQDSKEELFMDPSVYQQFVGTVL